jgi:hypothetical protein
MALACGGRRLAFGGDPVSRRIRGAFVPNHSRLRERADRGSAHRARRRSVSCERAVTLVARGNDGASADIDLCMRPPSVGRAALRDELEALQSSGAPLQMAGLRAPFARAGHSLLRRQWNRALPHRPGANRVPRRRETRRLAVGRREARTDRSVGPNRRLWTSRLAGEPRWTGFAGLAGRAGASWPAWSHGRLGPNRTDRRSRCYWSDRPTGCNGRDRAGGSDWPIRAAGAGRPHGCVRRNRRSRSDRAYRAFWPARTDWCDGAGGSDRSCRSARAYRPHGCDRRDRTTRSYRRNRASGSNWRNWARRAARTGRRHRTIGRDRYERRDGANRSRRPSRADRGSRPHR